MDAHFPWFILLAPLFSAVLIQLFLRKSRGTAAGISVLTVALTFIAALFVFAGHNGTSEIPWLDFRPAFYVPIGVTVDELSKLMLLVVTGVGTLVHIYSLVYMEEDESEARFFGNLSLFMFSMLGIVLANNFVMMFIFWELVGVSSYLLIGHWFTRDSAAAAANKAFLANRIGDFGFMLGILMVWTATGSVVFSEMQGALPNLSLTAGFLTLVTVLIFCGAIGKSAQFPLHVWLPDAMEGPTPVSALIHAATMVAAGVYMLARVSFLIQLSPTGQSVIAAIGIITAVLAALIATQQDDIKRILAYSTLSQLGYMICAIGLAAPGAAMFHLFTHAFFKALLFLGAGAIIHAMHHEQDIWKMGGLRKKMDWTFWTFAAGYLALIGTPLFSGFFSKDVILLAAWQQHSYLVFLLGVFTAFLTAFYMTRLFVVTFLGSSRSDAADHAHDGSFRMTAPLVILAFFSVFAGYHFIGGHALGENFSQAVEGIEHGGGHGVVATLAILAFVFGTGLGYFLYSGRSKEPFPFAPLRDKLYFDEIYAALIAGTQELLATMARFIDQWIIDGILVRATSGAVWGIGYVLRFLQFGNLQGYAFLFGLGVVATIYFLVFR
ncbi:NADH-quinone oxidoreductase subunit L [Chthoniobacter flavus]|nr:NADH-quinone oxidoreductase subunit L [Chthoniobacter flavus]TCO94578.1 NADH-quinone oxidoreductase subunit L [Chthoniobacter flavus]